MEVSRGSSSLAEGGYGRNEAQEEDETRAEGRGGGGVGVMRLIWCQTLRTYIHTTNLYSLTVSPKTPAAPKTPLTS